MRDILLTSLPGMILLNLAMLKLALIYAAAAANLILFIMRATQEKQCAIAAGIQSAIIVNTKVVFILSVRIQMPSQVAWEAGLPQPTVTKQWKAVPPSHQAPITPLE
ncbi:hypothetical protein F5B19DRAFT_394457 [Rostrohypoxylon terebratum]|nr:hypothetical protein F5B19DRAFT_394457 [Rostrohypoxylon terebratum]